MCGLARSGSLNQHAPEEDVKQMERIEVNHCEEQKLEETFGDGWSTRDVYGDGSSTVDNDARMLNEEVWPSELNPQVTFLGWVETS